MLTLLSVFQNNMGQNHIYKINFYNSVELCDTYCKEKQYCGMFRVCNPFLSQFTHDSQLPMSNCLGCPSCLQDNPSARAREKTHRSNVFIEPLPRNGFHNTAVLLLPNLATNCLPRACLRGNMSSISLPSNEL
jgi:hypothetical protein